ncbi:uncharacterized protein LOC143297333 [Babylonia areolata]|uniref:uncharacterized protein LOC143297333 n=1 Tax=Babylonia areolata TaxID=304850 RepID=UPI003FD29296
MMDNLHLWPVTLTLALTTLTLMPPRVTPFLLEEDFCPTEGGHCRCVAFNVHCEGLGLTSVPVFVAHDMRFTYLTLANNNITTLPPSAFLHLPTATLDLSHNPLTNISADAFRGLENVLQTLEMEDCSLTALPAALGTLAKLRSLDLRHNPLLTFLPTDVMSPVGVTLETLDISNTGIRQWPLALKTSIRLKKLLCSGNRLTSIPDDAFRTFAASLDYLDLSYNALRTFPDALNEPRRLTHLDLSFNLFGDVPEGNFRHCRVTLKTLYLVHVMMRTIPFGLQELSALQNLYLSYNPISSADPNVFNGSVANSLQVLHLDKTLLTSVPTALNRLTQLQELNITWNRIHYMDNYAINLPNLRDLYLDKNPLANIKFAALSGLPSLRRLYMRNTSLTFVPNSALGSVANLTLLDLSFNHFQALYDLGFPGMSRLQELRLSGNPLVSVTDHALDDLTSVSVLDLTDCLLTDIPRAVQQMHALRSVRMQGNDVNCTCDTLGWVKTWRENEGLLPRVEGACAQDDTLTIQSFIDNEGRAC